MGLSVCDVRVQDPFNQGVLGRKLKMISTEMFDETNQHFEGESPEAGITEN